MKHILLFFLSNIHLNKETGEFIHSKYLGQNGRIFDCVQTNEAAVDYMMSDLDTGLDALFFFSSNKTKECLTMPSKGELVSKTHIDWFKERVCNKYPALQNAFHNVDYDEKKDADESIRQVTEMTEMIKSYIDESDDKDICLHADMTGGFRHASMMMLSVMQLLRQYQGIRIGKVLYSNWMKRKKEYGNASLKGFNEEEQSYKQADINLTEPMGVVEDVTEVHRMFLLISGTDEFVNYGSVKEINRYFANRPKSRELEQLITTMDSFSDAIKICRTDKIESVVRNLQKCINEFACNTCKTVHERIFSQIITILVKEYGDLLHQGVTKLDIIDWCIRKDFLQQAMTLCTEWLPFVLVENKICYTEDGMIQLEALNLGIDMDRSWQQSFIINYKGTGIEKDKDKVITSNGPKGAGLSIYNYISGKGKVESAADFPEGEEPLLQLFSECEKFTDIFQELKEQKITLAEFAEKAPMSERAAHILWRTMVVNNYNYAKGFRDYLISVKKPLNLLNRIRSTFSEEQYGSLFSIIIKKNVKKREKNLKNKWEMRETEYRNMLDSGIMKTKCPGDVIHLLKGYFDIRMARNGINHATSNMQDFEPQGTESGLQDENEAIKVMMLSYLKDLKKFC